VRNDESIPGARNHTRPSKLGPNKVAIFQGYDGCSKAWGEDIVRRGWALFSPGLVLPARPRETRNLPKSVTKFQMAGEYTQYADECIDRWRER
jgi:hypothetical protein